MGSWPRPPLEVNNGGSACKGGLKREGKGGRGGGLIGLQPTQENSIDLPVELHWMFFALKFQCPQSLSECVCRVAHLSLHDDIQGGSYVLTIGGGGGKMPTVGSTSLDTKLWEAGIVILIHCATMLLKILNAYCLKWLTGQLVFCHHSSPNYWGAQAPWPPL